MSMYDRKHKPNLKFNFKFDWNKVKYPILGIFAVIFVITITLLVILPALEPRAITSELAPNPLNLKDEKTSFLTVSINNVTGETASNVIVSVETEASDAISIFPATREIPTLGKGENRTLSPFAISPNPANPVYSGTYFITISTVINGQPFSEQVAFELKAV